MSVIGVAGVPMRWTLKRFMNVLFKAKVIKGRFEALNFDKPRAGLKTAYIRISETVDPLRVLQNFQNLKLTSNAVFKAFIADSVPDLPLADKLYQRGGGLKGTQPKMTTQQKKASKAQQKLSQFERRSGVGKPPEWILKATHKEILEEVLSKYTKLLELSKKSDHKLVDDIAHTLFLRLKEIMDPDPDSWDTCFKLSKAYRKVHPHFADFQMILSHLHRLEDASGAPRSQLQEGDVAVLGPDPTDIICKFPYEKMQKICNKYADRIVEKLSEHIKSLDESALDDSPEQAARKRVYQELKKTDHYLEAVVRHVVGGNMSTPDMPAMHRMRIYGEPFLPGKEVMYPILHKLGATTITRSILMYNMVRVNVPLHRFAALAALDGSERGGAKLVVRQSNYGAYNVKQALIDEMKVAFGRAQPETKKADNQPEDQEDMVQDDDWGSEENLEMWM